MIKNCLVVCMTLIFLTGCTINRNAATEPPQTEIPSIEALAPVADNQPLTLTEDEYPRVDGSTATIPLGEAAAAVLMDKDRADCAKYAEFSGTDSAYRYLASGTVDLLMVYEASAETKSDLSGVRFKQAAIGADALVFLVNASNPVDNLTVDQIRGIYSGEISNWREVGGEDAPIAAFQRNATAGSQALMQSLVMGEGSMMTPPAHYLYKAMGELVTAVSNFNSGRYAIGYNVYYYVTEMKKDPNVKILSINGVAPDKDVISKGEYPLTNDFYAIIRAEEPDGSPASQIFNWLQGAEGQALIDMEGYAAKAVS